MERFKYTLDRKGDTTYFSIQRMPEEWRTKSDFVILADDYLEFSLLNSLIRLYRFCRGTGNLVALVACINCSRSEHRRMVAALKELQEWADNAMVDESNQKIDGGLNQNG